MAYEMRLERVLDAPPEIVFDALIDPDYHEELYAPEGWRLLESDMDLRVGGVWNVVIEAPEGQRYPIIYVFSEIDRPHRLRYTMSMTESGRTVDSFLDISFEDRNGRDGLHSRSGWLRDRGRAGLLRGRRARLPRSFSGRG